MLELLKCRGFRRKRSEKRNKPDLVATTAKPPDSGSQISCYGWTLPTYMRSVSFFGGNLPPAAVLAPAVAICLTSLLNTMGPTSGRCKL